MSWNRKYTLINDYGHLQYDEVAAIHGSVHHRGQLCYTLAVKITVTTSYTGITLIIIRSAVMCMAWLVRPENTLTAGHLEAYLAVARRLWLRSTGLQHFYRLVRLGTAPSCDRRRSI